MGAFLTTSATMMCPHGGTISATVADSKRATARAPVLTTSDLFVVGGCVFAPGGAAHPCVSVNWVAPAVKVTAGHAPALTIDSQGLCVAGDQAPQGPPILIPAQTQATGL